LQFFDVVCHSGTIIATVECSTQVDEVQIESQVILSRR